MMAGLLYGIAVPVLLALVGYLCSWRWHLPDPEEPIEPKERTASK